VKLHPGAELVDGVVVYRLDERLFFANADYVTGRIREALAGSPTPVRRFVFDAESLVSVDSTGVAALEALVDDFERREIVFVVARLKGPVRRAFDETGITARMGEERFFPTVRAAVADDTEPPGGG
jgi:SulP family sulfate permease